MDLNSKQYAGYFGNYRPYINPVAGARDLRYGDIYRGPDLIQSFSSGYAPQGDFSNLFPAKPIRQPRNYFSTNPLRW